jgi:signal transduction histidine kinase
VGGSVLIGTRRRMRLKLDRLEREQAVERERTRIAKDIHDDLGASLTHISMLSQSARASIEEPTNILRFLDQIFLTARESTRALADIVWAVNPSHDTLDSLAAYLQKFAQNFLRDANMRCRIDMPLELPLWPLTADIRHNLLLAFKEAVNNVVRHANATEIRISLKVEPQSFTLTIQDNGCGFKVPVYATAATPEQSPAVNGLKNMLLRLGEIGGRFEIVSSEGAGTKITFVLPIPTA